METALARKRRSRLSIASVALFIAGVLWIAAFALPVFETNRGSVLGYWVFLTGWLGLAFFQFAWYANLIMLLAIMLMYSTPIRASVVAGIGMLVATQAFWFNSVPDGAADAMVRGYGPGFWLWYSSILLLGFAVFFGNDDIPPDERDQLQPLPVVPAASVILEPESLGVVAVEKPSTTQVEQANHPWPNQVLEQLAKEQTEQTNLLPPPVQTMPTERPPLPAS